ncbi:MAG: rhodanese-related sulfurtransferase [Cyanobacteria bacterium J06554_6]
MSERVSRRWRVVTFYKFVSLTDCTALQSALLEQCQAQGIRGTILLAAEGINATISGSQAGTDAVLAFLKQDTRFATLGYKEAWASEAPFDRMKVKIKREIVTFGDPQANPTQQVGTYVAPEDWNQIIADPDITVIDTRNEYEVEIGSFKRAKNPQTDSFREFPDYVQQNLNPNQHKKVAMFCTGGIRCEKASAYLLNQGFEEVYQLEGGILKYLETVPEEESLWKGECFVFDDRVTVQHDLEPGSYDLCYACGHPVSPEDKASSDYDVEVSCPYCVSDLKPEKRKHLIEKRRQRQLMQQTTGKQNV